MTVSVERLDCGSLTAPRSMFESGGNDEPLTVPVPSWLIRHPDGLALVDAGMSAGLTTPGPYLDAVSLFFDVGLDHDQLIGPALVARGVDPTDVAVVILSHLHIDHAGGLAQIPDARVVVQAEEWAAGTDDDLAAANGFVPDDYLLGHDVVTVSGEHDVFGDGRVSCLPTPGHTPGHQSVRVRLEDRTLILCCDCAYFARTLTGGPLPPIGHDHVKQATSIQFLRATAANTGATLIAGHDPAVFASLPAVMT